MTGGLRYKFCPDCGDMHDVHDWPGNHRRPDERLSAPRIHSDLPAYESPVGTGMIEGRAARREDLARSGCREVDPGEKPDFGRPLRPKGHHKMNPEQVKRFQERQADAGKW